MAALRAVIIVATMAALTSHAAMATMYTVGAPNGGWDMSTDLQTWASDLNFTVGDSLVFRYASNHDVVEVVKAEYDACTASKPIQSFKGGNTLVFLPVAGKKYFICSVSGHCAAGMKLEVDVASASGTPQSPLSSPAPASAPAPMAPSPEQQTAPPMMMHEGAPSPSVATPAAAPPSDAPSTSSNTPTSSPPSIPQTVAPTPQLASAAPASDSATAEAPTPKSSGSHGCCGALAKSAIGFMVGLLLVLAM